MYILFIILAIAVAGWLIRQLKNKNASKVNRYSKATALGGAALLVLVVLIFITYPKAAKPVTYPKEPANIMATLNTQATAILTAATNNTAQQMQTGQTDAAMPGSLTLKPPSAFQQWRNTVEKDTDSNTDDNYEKAVSLYSDAYDKYNDTDILSPDVIDTWKKDNFAAYSDIGLWQLSEVTTLVGVQTNTVAPSDQTITNADYKQFQIDLTKAQADIAKVASATKTY